VDGRIAPILELIARCPTLGAAGVAFSPQPLPRSPSLTLMNIVVLTGGEIGEGARVTAHVKEGEREEVGSGQLSVAL
jgi:hypothetical protein